MLSFFVGLLLLNAFCFANRDMPDDEFEGSRTLVLEHSFQSGLADQFTKRGTIVIHSLKESKAQFTASTSLSPSDIDLLRSSAQTDGLYRVRIPIKTSNDGIASYVSSATKACGIVESGLKDEITVNFDQSGEVLGVSIRADVSSCAGLDVPDTNLSQWRTAVEVTTTVAGPSPDTQTYIEKMKRDEQEKLKNQDGDNRSFLGKYWMYIVPVVIMMVIMSSADQQAQGGGGR
ncbi:ER membrane protein complex subunit 10 [Aplysia californica]|uniref:ER membrane protein complex subunit 10 n=1 Tax=Aplysia californica TaxID=6500 RepID=A0ABM1ABT9_APLCA|nr:ER membrane protein complex subunit 10 [Aplysia californica]